MNYGKKLISIVMPCFNEMDNVREAYERVKNVFSALPQYDYEHLFIDNASTDRTVAILKEIAAQDKRVKVIVNARNFGHIRSPFHAYFQAKGDAIVAIVSDLQEPPEMIPDFIKKWEEGFKIVIAVRQGSAEQKLMSFMRGFYYRLIKKFSDIELIKNFSGFGLYDRRVVEALREIDEPYPYFRGLICEIGFKRAELPYYQPLRRRGITKNNFFTLYDNAMLGLTSHSMVPLRIATLLGFTSSLLGLVVALIYLICKIVFWNSFSVGIAPLLIGVYLVGSFQLFFLGIVGEYIGAMITKLRKRPIVEEERINFD